MTGHPMPLDLVLGCQLIEPPPEILILHRFAIRRTPAARFPCMQPLRDAATYVLRVGVHARLHRALQRFESADHRRELHPVVGRHRFGTGQLLLALAEAQERGPAARPGVTAASPVRIDLDDAHESRAVAMETRVAAIMPANVWWA